MQNRYVTEDILHFCTSVKKIDNNLILIALLNSIHYVLWGNSFTVNVSPKSLGDEEYQFLKFPK